MSQQVGAIPIDQACVFIAPWHRDGIGEVRGVIFRVWSEFFDPELIPNRVIDVALPLTDADSLATMLATVAIPDDLPEGRATPSRDLAELTGAEAGVIHPDTILVHPPMAGTRKGIPVNVCLIDLVTNGRIMRLAMQTSDVPIYGPALRELVTELERSI